MNRTAMINAAFFAVKENVRLEIYANGRGGNYGSTLPIDSSDKRVQYKISSNCVDYADVQAVCKIINTDSRVAQAYPTSVGLIRINFHMSAYDEKNANK